MCPGDRQHGSRVHAKRLGLLAHASYRSQCRSRQQPGGESEGGEQHDPTDDERTVEALHRELARRGASRGPQRPLTGRGLHKPADHDERGPVLTGAESFVATGTMLDDPVDVVGESVELHHPTGVTN